MSKIEAGKFELEEQEFGLRDCIQGSLDLLSGKAAEKGLVIAYVFSPDTPEAVVGDITRLRQVLVNLLNNALKFTETGEVVVTVADESDQSDTKSPGTAKRTLHFSVRDTGIGIPTERMNRLFQAFSQVDASISRRHGGTGLGLAISKRLTELMGGVMWAESTEGQGSTFHFTIKIEPAATSEFDYLREIQPQLRMKQVLIIEDNETNLGILSDQVTAWGMQLRSTGSADEALEWIRQGDPFDLAIVEKNLSGMDGADLSDAIREYRDAKALPIIMLAPMAERDFDLSTSSFDAVLNKPIKPSHFFDTLVNIATGKPVTRRTSAGATGSSFDSGMGKKYPLRILLTEDNVNNQKLALMVLGRLGYRADVAGNGIEALDALQRQDYDLVLMDVQMPDMDGLEATGRIREIWSNPEKPWIVAMTANAMQGDREMCISAGMNDYVTKPIRLEDLVASLKRSWESLHVGEGSEIPEEITESSNESTDQPESVALAETPIEMNDSVLDQAAIQRLEDLSGGDYGFMIDFIDTFLDGAPKMIGDLKQSLDDADAGKLRLVAHTLKSNSAALGAARLSELCKELEDMGKNETLDGALERIDLVSLEFDPIKSALESMRDDYGSNQAGAAG